MTQTDQPGLFDAGPLPPPGTPWPAGFRYAPGILTPDEEAALVRHVEALPFAGFEFHGFLGKRRVVSFGWRYDFGARRLQKADDVPPFLLPLRERAAAFAGLGDADEFRHALVTEYAPGAGIGWHRDKAVFGEVVGVSLLAPCDFRFRRTRAGPRGGWERATVVAEPRSAYLLAGPARTDWEHSIPAVDRLRYSVTFRTFRDAEGGTA
jgi:alkylated DNA repair dioxygenase AlkB